MCHKLTEQTKMYLRSNHFWDFHFDLYYDRNIIPFVEAIFVSI